MCTILSQRQTNLGVLRKFWQMGNLQGAIDALVKMNDLPVAVDFLNVAEKSMASNRLTLGMAQGMLPILKNLLSSRFEGYVQISLRYLKVLLRSFTRIVLDTRSIPVHGVDLSAEERLAKCNDVYDLFKSIYPCVSPITKKTDGVGPIAREVKGLLEKLLVT